MVGMKGVSYNIPDQTPTKLWIIENFKNGQIYTINMDTKQCSKTNDPVPTFKCIPGSTNLL